MDIKITWHIISKYLKGTCTEKELSEINNWINSDNKNKLFIEEVKKTWEASGDIYNNYSPDMKKGWEIINSETPESGNIKLKTIQWIIRAAAIIILVFGLGYLYNYVNKNNFPVKYSTQIASFESIKEIVLPDSTIVTLNENSKLEYIIDENRKLRKTKLTGEAFFNVKPDKNKPFIIYTDNTIVKVLGTSFNIKSDENVEVTVVTGKVALFNKSNSFKKVILKKDEKGIYSSKEKDLIKMKNDNLNFLSWKTGVLQFRNSSLTKVCETISDFYNTEIQISDPNIKDIPVTTKFDNQSLEEVIKVLSLTLDLQYKMDEDNTIQLYTLNN